MNLHIPFMMHKQNKKVYIYPTYTPSRDKSGNLYIKHFHEAFVQDKHVHVVNRFWKIGIASMFFNLDSDIFIIQWIDLIPCKRFGKIQFVLFLCAITFVKWMGKQLIWVLHNKHAHAGKSMFVDLGMKVMAKKANEVIVHAKEGVDFFDTMYPKQVGKAHYIPHPVYSQDIYPFLPIKYDYIIWGNIGRHKNVLDFLRFFNLDNSFQHKTILVCGQCFDIEYDLQIQKEVAKNSHIIYINRFVTDDELQRLISQTRIILFTYNPGSVLSSGALIYSLNFCKPIIGPRVGNFVDMTGIVSCYDTFDDILSMNLIFSPEAVMSYIHNNTWSLLPSRILRYTECRFL